MGWFSRMFSNSDAACIERARIYLDKAQYNDARIELMDVQSTEAEPLRKLAMDSLLKMNLDEAQARFSSGDYDGAKDHLELAREFGAGESQIREIRTAGLKLQKKRKKEAAEEKKRIADSKSSPSGDDPIWSLPPDDPRIRYAMRVESYPKELRKRLVELGAGFAEAALEIEDGDPRRAHTKLAPFVEKDPVARFERARAALAGNNPMAAISDLMVFGEKVGHTVIDNTHTAALLGQLLTQAGRGKEALNLVNQSRGEDDHPALAMIRSQILEGMDNIEDAEKETTALVERFPNNMGLIRQLARIRIKRDNRPGAAMVLESGLSRCCTPGQCSSQPLDLAAVRMLARIYLEDNVQQDRTESLLKELQQKAKEELWEDKYLAALVARNNAQPYADSLATKLVKQLSPNDPRRKWVSQSFPAVALS